MDDAEREQLKTFLDEFAALIGDVLKDEHAHWFPSNLVGPLSRAWDNEVSRKIGDIKSAIDEPQHQRALDEEGLAGEQLKLKMAAWRHARDGARQGPLSGAPRSWWQSVLRELDLGLRALQGALKIANSILKSIGKVIPAAGAVEEFKEILDGSLDLAEGRGPVKKLGSWVRRRFGRS